MLYCRFRIHYAQLRLRAKWIAKRGEKQYHSVRNNLWRGRRKLPLSRNAFGGVLATMYTDNEILFPHYAIPALRNARGPRWTRLIDSIAGKGETSIEVIALMSVMIELNGCLQCETDSYRAMRGCAPCAQQTLRRFKGSDQELIDMYDSSLAAFRESDIIFES